MKLLRFFNMTIGTDENRLSDSKVYASIIQQRDQEVQCFSHKIAISKDLKKVLNQQEIIFTIPAENHQEFFKELVIDPTHKCIWGITNFKSYKVFKNNSITEFNTTNYQKNID